MGGKSTRDFQLSLLAVGQFRGRAVRILFQPHKAEQFHRFLPRFFFFFLLCTCVENTGKESCF